MVLQSNTLHPTKGGSLLCREGSHNSLCICLDVAQKCFPPTWPSAAETGAFSAWQTCLFLPCQLSNGHNVCSVNQRVFFIHKAGERIKGIMPQWVIIKVKSSPLTSHPAVSHWHRGWRWLVVPRIHTRQNTLEVLCRNYAVKAHAYNLSFKSIVILFPTNIQADIKGIKPIRWYSPLHRRSCPQSPLLLFC